MGNSNFLEESFKRHIDLPFPEDSANSDLSAIHMELAEIDAYIAGIIDTTIMRGYVIDLQLPYLKIIKSKAKDLEKHLLIILQENSHHLADETKSYQSYLVSIQKLIETLEGYI